MERMRFPAPITEIYDAMLNSADEKLSLEVLR